MSEETGDNPQSGNGPDCLTGFSIFLLMSLAVVICFLAWDYYRRFEDRIIRLERKVEELERRR
jgi:hypothetical protein